MKTYNTIFNKALLLLVLVITASLWSSIQSQVMVPFTQRTSYLTPNQKIYNIKGDFQMIGNTNMQRSDGGTGDNGNTTMNYVDIDGIPSTLNSSSAWLTLPTGVAEADPACSNIIYAGLYWIGRSHDTGNSPHTFQASKTVEGAGTPITVNNNQTVGDNASINYSTYSLDITRSGVNNNRIITYTFTSSGTGNKVAFIYAHNNGTQTLEVSVNDGTATGVSTSSIDASYAYLSTPYTIFSEPGGITLTVNRFYRNGRNSQIDPARAYVNVSGTYTPPALVTKTLDKSVVYLKYGTETGYTTVSAQDITFSQNIYYPSNAYGNMYSAYAEVTDYVKQHGIGEYTVADIALLEGNGTSTGFFGGWGMIVVYENSKMKWRDVTIFDGHAYVAGNTTASYELNVSGFRTAQSGDIRVKLGLIAGEGDRSIAGDYFQIRNAADNAWVSLSHTGNTTDNFFNSSIPGSNPRNPNKTNNTGVDIAEFDINNTDNALITNNQTSTSFRYGSSQDTYIIPVIAMAVDAYVPDMVAYIQIGSVNGEPYTQNAEVLPNGDIEYTLELRNPGAERILNASVNIPIPYTSEFVSTSAEYFHGTGGTSPIQPYYQVTGSSGSIQWNIGTIPMGGAVGEEGNNDLLARLKFKLRATNNCFLLVNDNCNPQVLVEGSGEGVGETSGTEFHNLRFVHGYRDGACQGEPIIGPLSIGIDATDFVNANCGSTEPGLSIREFTFCEVPNSTTVPFAQVAMNYPAGSRFYSAVTTETIDGVTIVKPAEGAIEYTQSSSFPYSIALTTYYALPPSTSTCWWEFKIKTEQCNLWLGNISEDWATDGNWTQNHVPNGANEDVTFATVLNYGEDAHRDLVLDENRIIGNVTNGSPKRLRIPVNKTLVIDKKAITGSSDQLVIEAEQGEPNGALIFNNPLQNGSVLATVQFASKSEPAIGETWPRVWQFFSVPVVDQTLENLFGPNAHGSIYNYDPEKNIVVRKYNESLLIPGNVQEKWENLSLSSVMLPYHGYEITQPDTFVTNKRAHNLKGALVTNETHTMNFTISPVGTYSRGNYMLGNPYAAPIIISKIQDADLVNLAKTIYIYNTGSRKQWIDANGASQAGTAPGTYTAIPINNAETMLLPQIPSLQAFMLKAISDAPVNGETKFTFRYNTVQRGVLAGNNQAMYVKGASRAANSTETNTEIMPMIKMDVIGENSSDRVYLITAPGTSKAYDNGWDGYKTFSTDMVQLFAYTSTNGRMQVNTDEDLNDTYIGFRTGGEGTYKIKFSFNEQMLGEYSNIYVQDLATSSIYEVTDGSEFSFESATPGAVEKRFRFTANRVATDSPSIGADQVLGLTANPSSIIISNNSSQDAIVTVYDLVGKPIMTKHIPSGLQTIEHGLTQGTYLIEAKTADSGNRVTVKTIIGK